MNAAIVQGMSEECGCGQPLNQGNRCMVFGVAMCPACASKTGTQKAKEFAEEQMTTLDGFNGVTAARMKDRGPSLTPLPVGPEATVEDLGGVFRHVRRFLGL
jgi:hypothetical protein